MQSIATGNKPGFHHAEAVTSRCFLLTLNRPCAPSSTAPIRSRERMRTQLVVVAWRGLSCRDTTVVSDLAVDACRSASCSELKETLRSTATAYGAGWKPRERYTTRSRQMCVRRLRLSVRVVILSPPHGVDWSNGATGPSIRWSTETLNHRSGALLAAFP